MATHEWHLVQRRRRPRPPQPSRGSQQPQLTSTIAVYDYPRSYARVTANTAPLLPPPANLPSQQSQPSQPSHQPRQQPRAPRPYTRPPHQPRWITSPDSPTTLRFPPTNDDPDWKSRCFRCFRLGHTAANCANPRRCAICWGQGHEYHECPKLKNRSLHPPRRAAQRTAGQPPLPAAPRSTQKVPLQALPGPSSSQLVPPQLTAGPNSSLEQGLHQEEPDFLDLLSASSTSFQQMPPDSERPEEVSSYLFRDDKYFQEVARLSKGLVISPPSNAKVDFSIDDVARMVADTGLVTPKQL